MEGGGKEREDLRQIDAAQWSVVSIILVAVIMGR
jgi:hypothetical protein